MSKELTNAVFDYTVLEKDDQGKLRYLVKEITKHWTASQKSIIDIGQHIATAHAILAADGKDGKFSDWVRCEFGLSRQTAYNYMQAWDKFGDCDSIAQFDATAMYELAAPKTPETVLKAALKMAAKGQRIHAAEVKQLRKQHDEKCGKTSDSNCKTVLQLPTKSQASVSGTARNSTSDPPDLPSEGTANQTDSGSQDSGDAGECPNCSGTEWSEDDGGRFCSACKESEPVKNGQLDFDPSTLDRQLKSAKAGEPDLAKLQAPYDVMLNALTQIKKAWNEVTSDERDGVYAVTKRQRVLTLLDDLRPPIAQARPMKVCTFCKGKGCEKCSGCGWWPRSVVEGLSR